MKKYLIIISFLFISCVSNKAPQIHLDTEFPNPYDENGNWVSEYDIFISTAAVSDFEFKKKSDKKIDSSSSLSLNLKPTTKIIRQIKKINPDNKKDGE